MVLNYQNKANLVQYQASNRTGHIRSGFTAFVVDVKEGLLPADIEVTPHYNKTSNL